MAQCPGWRGWILDFAASPHGRLCSCVVALGHVRAGSCTTRRTRGLLEKLHLPLENLSLGLGLYGRPGASHSNLLCLNFPLLQSGANDSCLPALLLTSAEEGQNHTLSLCVCMRAHCTHSCNHFSMSISNAHSRVGVERQGPDKPAWGLWDRHVGVFSGASTWALERTRTNWQVCGLGQGWCVPRDKGKRAGDPPTLPAPLGGPGWILDVRRSLVPGRSCGRGR